MTDEEWQNGEMAEHGNIKVLLEQRASSGEPMSKFSLVKANLSGINLVKKTSKTGYQLTDSDLYRADLTDAHCFKLDLSGSSLMKADFSFANLHCANLSNCNLLGAVFKGAKLENVTWGEQIMQEQQAAEAQDLAVAKDYYEQAEEVYRNLRMVTEKQGLFEQAGQFFQNEMAMRRMQMPLFSLHRLISKFVDLFCGYGERPSRVVAFTLVVIGVFSILFFYSGIQSSGQTIAFDSSLGVSENFKYYLNSLYFSVVTYTTLGYGDISPTLGLSRFFAAVEALIGGFTLALFVVVFVKKMTR
ncbi:ion channel [uncultured Paraglaciecola sp.]|uniref:ion channel n=1 Tax=uncultured Paraglaciecola sp. TaxID=1765024 RepID=UPI0025CB7C07|nr:ion channel [uncultured Paraglaciecola sp.]